MKQCDLIYFQFFGEYYLTVYNSCDDKNSSAYFMPPGNYRVIDGEMFRIIDGFPPEEEKKDE